MVDAAKNYDAALQYYDAAVKLDKYNVCRSLHTIYSNIAAVYASKSDWKNSYLWSHHAITLAPNFAKGYSRMATALMALKNYQTARVAYSTCLQYDPQNEYARTQIDEIDRITTELARSAGTPAVSSTGACTNATTAPSLQTTSTSAGSVSGPGRGGSVATGFGLPKCASTQQTLASPGTCKASNVASMPGISTTTAVDTGSTSHTTSQPGHQPQHASSASRAPESSTGNDSPGITDNATKRAAPPVVVGVPDAKRQQIQHQSQASGIPSANTRPPAQQLQQMGNAAHRKGDHAEALRYFNQAVELYGSDAAPAELYSNRSAVLVTLGQYVEALADADRAISINPTWSRGHSRRGNALHAMSKKGIAPRWEDARAAYQMALNLDPNNEIVKRALEGLGGVKFT